MAIHKMENGKSACHVRVTTEMIKWQETQKQILLLDTRYGQSIVQHCQNTERLGQNGNAPKIQHQIEDSQSGFRLS